MASVFPILAGFLTAIAGLVLVAAALHDFAFRTVPNWMSLVLCAAGLVLHTAQGDLLPAMIAGFIVFAAATLCWRRGWLGGGDVKLLAAAVIVVRPVLTANLLLDVALAGGLLAGCYLALGRVVSPPGQTRPAGLMRRIWRAECYRIHRRGPLPYASAIAAGALLVLFKG